MKTILTITILAITISAFSQVKERDGKFYNKKELWDCIQPDLSGQKCVSYTQTYITETGDTVNHGKYLWFISPTTGDAAQKGEFKHGIMIVNEQYQEGVLSSKIIYYYPSGKTKQIETFKAWGDGSIMSRRKYNEKGEEIENLKF